MDTVFVQGGAAATFAKILVDCARMIWPTAPAWVFPLLALLLSPVCLLAMMALGEPIVWSQQTAALVFLGSVTCAGVAVGASAVQKKADDARREGP
jgi:hypothetical protein